MTDTLVLVDSGLSFWLRWLLNNGDPFWPDPQLFLFLNEIDPDCGTVLADLTEWGLEGGGRYSLTKTSWLAPTVTTCCGTIEYNADLPYTNTGDTVRICGYAIVLTVFPETLLAVQALSEPFDLLPGQTTSVRPKITLTTGACPLFT